MAEKKQHKNKHQKKKQIHKGKRSSHSATQLKTTTRINKNQRSKVIERKTCGSIIAVFIAIYFYLFFPSSDQYDTPLPPHDAWYNDIDINDPFFKLANDFGVYLNGIKLDANKNNIRGVIATKDINKGEVIMSIPHPLILLPSTHTIRDILASYPNMPDALRSDVFNAYVAYDITFKTKQFETDPFWKLYYSHFLSTLNHSSFTFYSPKSNLTKFIRRLAPWHVNKIQFKKKFVVDVWNSYNTHHINIKNIAHFDRLESNSAVIKYKHYYDILTTRAFDSGTYGAPYLVPYLDMINHEEEHLINVDIVDGHYKTGMRLNLVASERIHKGDELLVCYKPSNNANLLIDYGIVLDLNVQERGLITYYKNYKMLKNIVKEYDTTERSSMLLQLQFELQQSPHLLPSLAYIWEYYAEKNEPLKQFVLNNYHYDEVQIAKYVLPFVDQLQQRAYAFSVSTKSKRDIEIELMKWQTNVKKQLKYFDNIYNGLTSLDKEYKDNFYIHGLIKLLKVSEARWKDVRDFVDVIQNGLNQPL